MFTFSSYEPEYRLKNYIKAYWFVQYQSTLQNCSRLILAHDEVCITFALSDNISQSNVFIFPPSQTSYKMNYEKDVFYIDVSLRAGIFFNLFNIPVSKLNKESYELNDVSLEFDSILLEKLNTIKKNQQLLIGELNNFFIRLFSKNFKKYDQKLNQILSFSKTGDIDTFCKEEKLSIRQVQRITQQYIGLTPHQVKRINKFYDIVRKMKYSKQTISFSTLALEYNFSDQSHLIKEFKYFCNTSPKKFLIEKEHFLQFGCDLFC